MTSGSTRTFDTIVKTLDVPVSPALAFTMFTEELYGWWPYRTHSIGQQHVAAIIMEPRVGGRLYERLRDGTEHAWGEVRAWDPARSFTTTWYPGQDDARATELTLTFTPTEGGTRVVLDHCGWEVFGDEGAEHRSGYDTGWNGVLAEFVQAAARARR